MREINFDEWLKTRIETCKFNEKPHTHLTNLIDGSFSYVKNYATQKLAGIFFNCVAWSEKGPRKEADWFFAEDCIDEYLGREGIRTLAERGIVLCAYSTLPEDRIRQISGDLVQHLTEDWHLINTGGLVWLNYKERLKKLPDEALIEHLSKGHAILPENLDLYCGRSIWEIYQSAKETSEMIIRGYGRILFH